MWEERDYKVELVYRRTSAVIDGKRDNEIRSA